MKSFIEFLQLKEQDNPSAMNGGKTANEVIADLLHFKVGDKLLFNDRPIQIENIMVDATDSNKKTIQKSFNSVEEAAGFIDNNNLMSGVIEAYFGNNPIYLLNIYNGTITRHHMADKLLQQFKTMPANSPYDKMQSYGESKKHKEDKEDITGDGKSSFADVRKARALAGGKSEEEAQKMAEKHHKNKK
jgi:hypothetical protein